MRKPSTLQQKDVVGLISPSGPSSEDSLEKAVKALERLGFIPKPASGCLQSSGYLAGPDETRARDIHEMFSDPEVKGIFCLRGGYGAMRLLDILDMELISQNPKVFLGSSDVTALHLAFNKLGGFCTFYGPMVAKGFTKQAFRGYVEDNLMKMTCSAGPPGEIIPRQGEPPMETLVPGIAEGKLVGGNLAIVCALMGTPWEIETKDRILVLEDTNEPAYRIDRMLTHLRLAGKFREACGIVLGQFTNVRDKNEGQNFTLKEIFQDVVAPEGRPTLLNGGFGHGEYTATLPLGAKARIDSSNNSFVALEAGVC